MIFSILSIILAVVGSIVDGIGADFMIIEQGCMNTDTGDLYGTSSGKEKALLCVISADYSNDNYNNYGSRSSQCVCASNDACFGYYLASGSDCGLILTYYYSLLAASTAILAIIAAFSLLYSIFTCVAICSRSTEETAYAAPPMADVETVQMQSGGAVYIPSANGQPVQYTVGAGLSTSSLEQQKALQEQQLYLQQQQMLYVQQQQQQVPVPSPEYQQVSPVDPVAVVVTGVVVSTESPQDSV